LVDDELGYLEPLRDALHSEGYRVLTARTGEDALNILEKDEIHLTSIDVMLPPGQSLEDQTSSQKTGIYIAREILSRYPDMDVFCLSVINDTRLIQELQSMGVRFLRKGETPLRTVLNMMRSRLTGIAYSTENSKFKR
jgi:CheY-like chemotaxis protein